MSKTKSWSIILLVLVVLVLIDTYLADKDNSQLEIINKDIPTYKSDYSDTVIYSAEGKVNYRLITQYVEYFSDKHVSLCTLLVMTIFDNNKIPTWSIRSDRAKLTNNHMLYLYGHVELNALTTDTLLRRITTDNAQINLITQDVISQDLVTLHGITFNSVGLRMRGNLRSKNAELIEKVRTSYEIQSR